MELQRGSSDTIGVRIPPTAVVTGIKGGVETRDKSDGEDRLPDTGYTCTGEETDEANRVPFILTTVRMEHSYV